MPKTNTCCCCVDLRTGSLILGWLGVIVHGLGVAGGIFKVVNLKENLETWKEGMDALKESNLTDLNKDINEFSKWFQVNEDTFIIRAYVEVGIHVVLFIVDGLLLKGIYGATAKLMLPSMITNALIFIIFFIIGIISFLVLLFINALLAFLILIAHLISFILPIHFALVIWGYYGKLNEDEEEDGD